MQADLFTGESPVDIAVARIKEFEPKDGYYLAFSGGKDSVVIKTLADMAEVKYDAHYNVTGIDPPELVRFIREQHPDVIFHKPEEKLWDTMLRKQMPPTQLARYCCETLKERGGEGRVVVTGVRRAESNKRNSRGFVEGCKKGGRRQIINPIVDWSDSDVWEFIRQYNIPYCKLYDEGFKRLGCVGCPMANNQRLEQYRRWPRIERAWRRAFDRLNADRRRQGKGEYTFEWWMRVGDKGDPDQTILFE